MSTAGQATQSRQTRQQAQHQRKANQTYGVGGATRPEPKRQTARVGSDEERAIGVRTEAAIEKARQERSQAYHKWERGQTALRDKRRRRAEVGDPWNMSPHRFATWLKMTTDSREGAHVSDVDVKPSLLRYLDGFTLGSAMKQLEYLYPDEWEAFALAYPIDDEARPLSGEEVAIKLHMSRATAYRRIGKARFLFRALYEGLQDHETRMHRVKSSRGVYLLDKEAV